MSRRASPPNGSTERELDINGHRARTDPSSVRLRWSGRQRRWEEAPRPTSSSSFRSKGLRTDNVEIIGDASAAHRLVHGEGLDLVEQLHRDGLAGKVDLVYVDPPYASDRELNEETPT